MVNHANHYMLGKDSLPDWFFFLTIHVSVSFIDKWKIYQVQSSVSVPYGVSLGTK
jgi:hypothetical protein